MLRDRGEASCWWVIKIPCGNSRTLSVATRMEKLFRFKIIQVLCREIALAVSGYKPAGEFTRFFCADHLSQFLQRSFFPFLGERPYKCHLPDCGRAFIQLSNLQQHLRNHDAQVERAKNRPFHCNICGKGFATESSLRTHTSKVRRAIEGLNCKSSRHLLLDPLYRQTHIKSTARWMKTEWWIVFMRFLHVFIREASRLPLTCIFQLFWIC